MSKKEKKEIEKKEFTSAMFLKNFIVVELVILYIVLIVGDAFSTPELSKLVTRFVPVGIVAFISTFLVIRSNAKKCKKTEEESVKRNTLIAPVIVAVILLVYGLYSVESNVQSIKDSYFFIRR